MGAVISPHYLTSTYTLKAAHFAAQKHRDQRRKDEEISSYINHPVSIVKSEHYPPLCKKSRMGWGKLKR
jgi:hypothetical protein